MTHYARLDVSLEEIAIYVVDGTGRIVKERRAASEPEALINPEQDRPAVGAHRPGGLLADGLAVRGAARCRLPAICIETRQAIAAMEAMPNKTDRNDARADGRETD